MNYKTFLLTLLFALLIYQGFTQNRIATQADIDFYGDYITVGDMIIDTPTKLFPDSINQLRIYYVSTDFPTMRENATIWVDGERLGPVCEFRIVNEKEDKPWHIQSATLRPIPGTRLNCIYTHNGYGGHCFLIMGLKNLVIDGETEGYPGLSAFPTDRKFLKGTFGIGVTSIGIYEGFHGFSVSVLNGGTFSIKGVEAEHGFSALRFQGGNYDWIIESVEVARCYFHDTESEATYMGATHSPPLAKLKNFKFYDCILSRAGSEAIQLQHLIGNSHIHNVTVYSPACGYIAQFQQYQDTGSQWNIDQGYTLVEKLFFDSWGSHAANFFGSAEYAAGCDSKFVMKKIAMNDGRGEGFYFHPSCKYGMTWHYDSIYIRGTTNDWYINNKAKPTDWQISSNNGTDSIYFKHVFHDGSKPKVFQNTAKMSTEAPTLIEDMPDVEYVNSGFHESAKNVKFWRQYYAKYFTGNDTTATQIEVGDIMIDRENDHDPVFCKALVRHKSTATRPKNSPNYVKLTWDVNGVRSDQSEWKSTSVQMPYPPDDLRIKHDNFYGQLGIGLVQEPPTCDCDQLNADLAAHKIKIQRLRNLIFVLSIALILLALLHLYIQYKRYRREQFHNGGGNRMRM